MELPAFIINSIKRNKTSLGEHPAFPPEEEEMFVLSLVREYFDSIAHDAEIPSCDKSRSELAKIVADIMLIETKNKESLESLAQTVVGGMFDIPQDSVTIETHLVTKINSDNDRLVPEKTVDFQFDNIADMRRLTSEVYKRRMLNALVVGASQTYAEDVARYVQEVFSINPELPSLYKKLIDNNKLLLYVTNDSVADKQKTDASRVDVYLFSQEEQPKIVAQSLCFPMLVESAIKGLLELSISHGLPIERKKAEYVVKKADFKLAELWDVRIGVPLWQRLMKVFEKCGKDPIEVGLNFIFMHIAMLEPEDFNEFMQESLLGTSTGVKYIDSLCTYIEQNKESDDFDDFIDSQQRLFAINDDEFFSAEELISESEEMLAEAMTLNNIKEKWYADIPEDVFAEIVQSDPTYNTDKPDKMGKYGKWLLGLYKSKNLKTEDLYKAKEYLTTFVKYYSKMTEKDINKYKSLAELYDAVEPFIDNTQSTSKSEDIRNIKKDAEKVYEDDEWLIVVPHTEDASCYYGKGTQWCTAADKSQNMFDEYNEQGPLYININKKNGHKWQFHFETDSFMDERDHPVDSEMEYVGNAIGLTDGAGEYYKNIGHPIYQTIDDVVDDMCNSLPSFDVGKYNWCDDDDEREQMLRKYEEYCNDKLEWWGKNGEIVMINERCMLLRVFNKWSMFDTEFNNLINNQWFDGISEPHCGWMLVSKDNKCNYLHPSGDHYLLKEWVDDALVFNTETKTALIEKNDKWNMINTFGEVLFKNWYDFLDWQDHNDNTLLKVSLNGLWNFIDRNERPLLERWCNKLGFFGNNRDRQTREPLAYVSYGKDGEYYVDRKGNLRKTI